MGVPCLKWFVVRVQRCNGPLTDRRVNVKQFTESYCMRQRLRVGAMVHSERRNHGRQLRQCSIAAGTYAAFKKSPTAVFSWARWAAVAGRASKQPQCFFDAEHRASCIGAEAKSNDALTPFWHHCRLIELGLFDCSEIYEKTSKNL